MKRIIVIVLLTCLQSFAQSGLTGILGLKGGDDYLPQTLSYKARVEADGGTIIDLKSVDNFYKNSISNNYLDSLKFWWEADCGLKKNANDMVVKRYDLSYNQADDLSGGVGDTTVAMKFFTNKLNGKPGIGATYGTGKRYINSNSYFTTGNHNDDATYICVFARITTISSIFCIEQRAKTTGNGLAIVGYTNFGVYDASGSGYTYSTFAGNNTNPFIAILSIESLAFDLWVNGSSRVTGTATGVGTQKDKLYVNPDGKLAYFYVTAVASKGLSTSKIQIIQSYLNTKYLIY